MISDFSFSKLDLKEFRLKELFSCLARLSLMSSRNHSGVSVFTEEFVLLVHIYLLYQVTAEQQALLRFLQSGWQQICRTHTCNQKVPREADNKAHNPTFLGNIAGRAG